MANAINLKLSFPQLALLDWLFERDRKRFFSVYAGSHSPSEINLYEVTGVDEAGKKIVEQKLSTFSHGAEALALIERLGGRAVIKTLDMHRADFFKAIRSMSSNYDGFVSQFTGDGFNHQEIIYLVTDKAREWWAETGKEQFETLASERAMQRAAVDRLIVVGVLTDIKPKLPKELADKLPAGTKLPFSRQAFRPQAIARVVKETASRIYVADVRPLREWEYCEGSAVQGRKPNQYVVRDNVILDDADMDTALKLAEIDAEHEADICRITVTAVEAMLPALMDLEARLLQKDAEREDLMREATSDNGPKKKR